MRNTPNSQLLSLIIRFRAPDLTSDVVNTENLASVAFPATCAAACAAYTNTAYFGINGDGSCYCYSSLEDAAGTTVVGSLDIEGETELCSNACADGTAGDTCGRASNDLNSILYSVHWSFASEDYFYGCYS